MSRSVERSVERREGIVMGMERVVQLARSRTPRTYRARSRAPQLPHRPRCRTSRRCRCGGSRPRAPARWCRACPRGDLEHAESELRDRDAVVQGDVGDGRLVLLHGHSMTRTGGGRTTMPRMELLPRQRGRRGLGSRSAMPAIYCRFDDVSVPPQTTTSTASVLWRKRACTSKRRCWQPIVFGGLELPHRGRLLELGCGVGAELSLIAGLRPDLALFGIDASESHVAAAHDHLADVASVARADAMQLPFADNAFDVVLTVWLLEHVGDPAAVMGEAVRVLAPNGVLICTEVDNETFRFHPPMPAISTWWDLFCHRQLQAGGDPYVGRRMATLAAHLGCRDIDTTDLAVVSSAQRAGPPGRAPGVCG